MSSSSSPQVGATATGSAAGLASAAPAQFGSHSIAPGPEESRLNTTIQSLLRKTTGLSERVCEKFTTFSVKDGNSISRDNRLEGLREVTTKLENGKFKPGLFKRFLMKLGFSEKGNTYEQREQRFELKQMLKDESFRDYFLENVKEVALNVLNEQDALGNLKELLNLTFDLLSNFPNEREGFFTSLKEEAVPIITNQSKQGSIFNLGCTTFLEELANRR
jgi:hypothetical protein